VRVKEQQLAVGIWQLAKTENNQIETEDSEARSCATLAWVKTEMRVANLRDQREHRNPAAAHVPATFLLELFSCI
jgi:hypothetical protein